MNEYQVIRREGLWAIRCEELQEDIILTDSELDARDIAAALLRRAGGQLKILDYDGNLQNRVAEPRE
jgi:hypothetical protein